MKDYLFQSTHSHGVRLARGIVRSSTGLFQSTHSHGVRRHLNDSEDCPSLISIHALTWSATIGRSRVNAEAWISIHALTWSATRKGKELRTLDSQISIHALTWSATPYPKDSREGIGISIHALTWSATCSRQSWTWVLRDFNPRTHMECDVGKAMGVHPAVVFQSTHSHGVRQWKTKIITL